MSIKYHYNQFPPNIEVDKELASLICQARTSLGRYDGFLLSMRNQDVLLSPLFTQEAVLSSRIEGTQSTLTEVLEFEAKGGKVDISERKRTDILEVINYRDAISQAIEDLKTTPLSIRIIKSAHKKLMQGVRGENKAPGEYRKIPVWIGGTSLENARFIPIEAQKIDEAIGIFEKYIHKDNQYDDLLKVAVLHAEFEAIHPFLDGNGRSGRMLIPLYLWNKQLLSSPSFYISSYFEKNRHSYYDGLLEVSETRNWLNWCKFFIQGLHEQAEDNLNRAKKIIDYYEQLKLDIPKISKSAYGITALDFIFKHTHFPSTFFYDFSGVPRTNSKNILDKLVQNNLLECVEGRGRTPHFYIFKKLIDIADGQ